MRNICRILVMVWSVLMMIGGILTFDFVNFFGRTDFVSGDIQRMILC